MVESVVMSSRGWIRFCLTHSSSSLPVYPRFPSLLAHQPISINCSITSFLPFNRRTLTTTRHDCVNINDNGRLNIVPIRLPGSARLLWPARTWPKVSTTEDAKVLALQLDSTGRQLLLEQLQAMDDNGTAAAAAAAVTQPLSNDQLYRIFLYNGLPFVGFGVLDNGIMIVAGEYIDITIGIGLGISTMAAAALGNLVSDVAGVGTAGYVELLVAKFGVTPIEMTTTQSLSRSVRWTVAFGRALGIAVGCIIGMVPLLFFDKNEEDSRQIQKITSKSTLSSEASSQDSNVSPGPASTVVTQSSGSVSK